MTGLVGYSHYKILEKISEELRFGINSANILLRTRPQSSEGRFVDFYRIVVKKIRTALHRSDPDWKVGRSKDLMTRGLLCCMG